VKLRRPWASVGVCSVHIQRQHMTVQRLINVIPTKISRSLWQVGIMLNDLAVHNMVIGGPAHQSKQIEVSPALHLHRSIRNV
jgi:hypothetical protein